MSRFVILEHESPQGRHWDFMLEHGAALATWALPVSPDAAEELVVQPLPDHRPAYLDYEGPISGGRGSVVRWDQGTYRTERRTKDQWVVTLEGRRLRGRVTLERLSDERGWRFRWERCGAGC